MLPVKREVFSVPSDFIWQGPNPFLIPHMRSALGVSLPRIIVSDDFYNEWKNSGAYRDIVRRGPKLSSFLMTSDDMYPRDRETGEIVMVHEAFFLFYTQSVKLLLLLDGT